MNALTEAATLFQRANDLRWRGENEEAREYANRAIKMGNIALDAAREQAECREASTLLQMCIQLHDGIGVARR